MPELERYTIRDFSQGLITSIDDLDMPDNAFSEIQNVIGGDISKAVKLPGVEVAITDIPSGTVLFGLTFKDFKNSDKEIMIINANGAGSKISWWDLSDTTVGTEPTAEFFIGAAGLSVLSPLFFHTAMRLFTGASKDPLWFGFQDKFFFNDNVEGIDSAAGYYLCESYLGMMQFENYGNLDIQMRGAVDTGGTGFDANTQQRYGITIIYDGIYEAPMGEQMKIFSTSTHNNNITIRAKDVDSNSNTTTLNRRITGFNIYRSDIIVSDTTADGQAAVDVITKYRFLKYIDINTGSVVPDDDWAFTTGGSGFFEVTFADDNTIELTLEASYEATTGYDPSFRFGRNFQDWQVRGEHATEVSGRPFIADCEVENSPDGVGATEKFPSRVYYGHLDANGIYYPDMFTPLNYMDFPELGRIMGIVSVLNNLVVLGERDTMMVSIGDGNEFNYRVIETLQDAGCVSSKSIVEIDGSVYFAGRDNIWRYNGQILEPITYPFIHETYEALTDAQKEATVGGYWRRRHQYVIYLNTTWYFYNIRTGTWSRSNSKSDADYKPRQFFRGTNDELFYCDSDATTGIVREFDGSGTPLESTQMVIDKITDFGYPDVFKRVKYITLDYKGSDDFTVDLYVDRNATAFKSLTFSSSASRTRSNKIRINAIGRVFRIKITSASATNKDNEINSADVDFKRLPTRKAA